MPRPRGVDFSKVRIGRGVQPLGSAGPKPGPQKTSGPHEGVRRTAPAGPKPGQANKPETGERK